MEIEEVAAHHPEKILRVAIDPAIGLSDFYARRLGFGLGLKGKQIAAFGKFLNAIYQAFKGNAARLAIAGGNPALLAGQDPEKIARANKVASQAAKPAMEIITRHEINWNIVAAATPAWAALAFPEETPEKALEKLWKAIFTASRVYADDPVAEAVTSTGLVVLIPAYSCA